MDSTPNRPRFEVADILRSQGAALLERHDTTSDQRKVIRHLVACRTAELGGHVEQCDSCGHTRISYNSCRDRHCPKCQNLKKAEWLEERREHLLPIPYFHVVFTLPEELNALILRNPRQLFALLFDAAARTLDGIARDPKHLGAEIGFTAILHTWGQQLQFHPHLHCVVTGGGLSEDGSRWIPTRPNFLFPVKVLGRFFRGKFLDALRKLYEASKLDLKGACADLALPGPWKRLLDRLYQADWVVYAKPPFGGPDRVFQYLGRYTHRVAISNQRIVEVTDQEVAFRYRDYRDENRSKILRLQILEFIRRFLLHVLPSRFVKIRHYGILGSRNVKTKIPLARNLLSNPVVQPENTVLSLPLALLKDNSETWYERFLRLTGVDVLQCPRCQSGRFVRTQIVQPIRPGVRKVPVLDTS